MMQTDPILRAFFNPHIHEKYRQSLDIKRKKTHLNYAYDLFAPQLEKWQDRGEINEEVDIKLLLAVFDSIFYVLLHKKDIGEEFFPEIVDFLIDSVLFFKYSIDDDKYLFRTNKHTEYNYKIILSFIKHLNDPQN